MCAKADYWSEQDVIVWRMIFAVTIFLMIVAASIIYYSSRGAEPVAPVLPEYKIEPQTTLTARP